VKIKISELQLGISEPGLDKLTPWEMKNLQGGYMTRRQRRNAQRANTTDTSDFSTMFRELDNSLEQWKIDLQQTTDSWIDNFNF
jgi:hypothetical protein